MNSRITPQVIEALTRLLDYTEPVEMPHYDAITEHEEREDHIYLDICFLRGWVESLEKKSPRSIQGNRRK
jgi:hypothetical protein